MTFSLRPAAIQGDQGSHPFDRSFDPDGEVSAEFFRISDGILVRFPDQADFDVNCSTFEVSCTPVPGQPISLINSLYRNSICPLVANYQGGLNLHASAVSVSGEAIAFIGVSGAGKSTLAASFAKSGHAIVTEDVLTLEKDGDTYWALPSSNPLRLCADSSSFLFGEEHDDESRMDKMEFEIGKSVPGISARSPLEAIFFLGAGAPTHAKVDRLESAQAFAELIRHAFILDVEDKNFLSSHFIRVGELASAVPCFQLDYPRAYEYVPELVRIIHETVTGVEKINGS